MVVFNKKDMSCVGLELNRSGDWLPHHWVEILLGRDPALRVDNWDDSQRNAADR